MVLDLPVLTSRGLRDCRQPGQGPRIRLYSVITPTGLPTAPWLSPFSLFFNPSEQPYIIVAPFTRLDCEKQSPCPKCHRRPQACLPLFRARSTVTLAQCSSWASRDLRMQIAQNTSLTALNGRALKITRTSPQNKQTAR